MPMYESVFIARQDISATQAEQLADTFAALIAEHGGTVAKKEYWGLKNLAFRIKKNRKGHYTLFNIDAPPAAILEMERNMRISEDVLRYLTVRVDELEEGPSAMLQSRHRDREGGGRDRDGRFRDRDDRGPRRDRPFDGDRDRERERPAAAEGEAR
jgi:small subunit ribosomal protein S6